MNITYRTYENDDDISGIVKVFKAAFWRSNFSSFITEDFWRWKYNVDRPNYDPDGYQIAIYKNSKIVGTVICTIREMNFFGTTYKVGCIDDVATIPQFWRRGISQTLLNNAIKFMEERNMDLSMLVADPGYHAHKFYYKNGYDYATKCRIAFKLIEPLNMIKNLRITLPITGPIYALEKFQEYRRFKSCELPIRLYQVKNLNDEFLQEINKSYRELVSFEDFTREYWNWFRLIRPKMFENICIAAKLDGKIIGGGSITKTHYLILNTKKSVPFHVVSEIFVNKSYRRKGVGSQIYRALESIAARNGTGFMIGFWNKFNRSIQNFLSRNGFFLPSISDVEMIKPISNDFKKIYPDIKLLKGPWHIALEQSGF
ncbi:MAG: GNAT family N-acetyltransferase [Candidatus Lokiarchaeota archaeon]|nr:GNAT family N-acetyltransferase [Candidatus Lokiarchaeota archaeon]